VECGICGSYTHNTLDHTEPEPCKCDILWDLSSPYKYMKCGQLVYKDEKRED
jgi:hypothetical protein